MTKALIRSVLVPLLCLTATLAFAQSPPAAAAPNPSQGLLSGPQLEALVSPIALYPDALLSEMLMASTYPLEVVAADRWAKGNKNLQGDPLRTAVEAQPWDQSVKSLVATPDVLDMMSSKLDWTQQLGDAMLAQQPEVMDAIQRLRQRAQSRGKLTTTPQQTVATQPQGGKQVITIEPTSPDDIYVPYYDPAVVYGDWPYQDYPPYYFESPGYIGAGIIATGIAFGGAYALARWGLNGYRWGGRLNWGNNQINPLRSVNNVNIGNNNWVHNPAHRQGMRYNNPNVAQKFGGNRGNNPQNRGNLRGSNGRQVLNPGGGNRAQPGHTATGNRQGRGNTGAGNRPTQKSSVNRNTNRNSANRPSTKRATTAKRTPTQRTATNRSGANRRATHGATHRPAHTASRGAARAPARTFNYAGGARHAGGMGGGMRGGGARGGGARGGGRRSDLRLKHDVVEVARLRNGVGLYRFVYNGGHTVYVGVIAQEVQKIVPAAVSHGADGYLRVRYDRLGLKFQTYREWLGSGGHANLPAASSR
jgi:hypothetical protein